MASQGPDSRSTAELSLGRTLKGKWRLERVLDVGGMAAVYEAVHRNGKRFAVKMLHQAFANDHNVRSRFLREGYVANKINHPGAVSILDDDTDGDAVFLVMELLVGESLEAWLKRSGGRLPIVPLLAMADQVLAVLAAAHAHGVIHRDVKPGNLFITTTGQAKVLDFGLARLLESDGSTKPTGVGIVLGTTSYMAPEQATGRPEHIDGRVDLFALGAVLFRSLTGRFIHAGTTPAERVLAAMHRPAPPIGSIVRDLEPAVAELIDRALAFDKNDRYETAGAMLTGVRRAYAALRSAAPALPSGLLMAPTGSPVQEALPSETIELSLSSFELGEAPVPQDSLVESISGCPSKDG